MGRIATMNCIHNAIGLCDACQAEHDEDPIAWIEFGQHEAGIENWHRLQVEMDEERQRLQALPASEPDPTISY